MGKIYNIIRDMLIAIFGGLVGAILSLYASGNAQGWPSIFLIILYGGILFLVLLIEEI